jgi:hypothetical protein
MQNSDLKKVQSPKKKLGNLIKAYNPLTVSQEGWIKVAEQQDWDLDSSKMSSSPYFS